MPPELTLAPRPALAALAAQLHANTLPAEDARPGVPVPGPASGDLASSRPGAAEGIARAPTMKPHVICHMVASVDGRILHSRWRPRTASAGDLFERLHERLAGDAWLVGRVTGQEFAKKRTSYPDSPGSRYPREAWLPRIGAPAYGVVLDAHGRIAWGRGDIGGDPIVVALSGEVSDSHLAGLRADGVSYFFAGERQLAVPLVLDYLRRELGVKRLLLEGGGTTNGEFLRAGLVDEVSLALVPAIDGARDAPSVFHSRETDAPAPLEAMSLESCEPLEHGAVWLRYRLRNAPGAAEGARDSSGDSGSAGTPAPITGDSSSPSARASRPRRRGSRRD
jgi:riboflavin biosynthesis pyrimidine reductase